MSTTLLHRALLPVFLLTAQAQASVDCAALYAELRTPALELDYTLFDQTPGRGFRVLAEADCPREAADLIEAYLQHTAAAESSLIWHLAQMRAEAGQTKAALAAARRSLDPHEAPDAAFRWNDYVRATIAFLEQDRADFDRYHRSVRSADGHPGNVMNSRLLDQLAAHFDSSYREAVRADN